MKNLILVVTLTTAITGCEINNSRDDVNSTSPDSRPAVLSVPLQGDWKVGNFGIDGISLSFSNTGGINGYAGCNRYFGGYKTADNNNITFYGIGSTKMACFPDRLMQAENKFHTALSNTRTYQATTANQVNLLDENNNVLITLNK